MSIHPIVAKRFDVDSNSGLPSGTPMFRFQPRRLPLPSATFVLTTLFLALGATLVAQAPHSQHYRGKHMEHEQIIQLEQEWRRAALADDVPDMDKLLSDDYIGITSSGEVLTKTQQLDHMRNRDLVITRLDVSELKIKLIGNIAIVTSLAQVEGSSDGEPLQGAYRYTRVYQRLANGIWKITNFEVTPATHPHHSAANPAKS